MRHVVYRCIIAAVVISFLFAAISLAQTPAPSFDVASIRPAASGPPDFHTSPGSLIVRNRTLLYLICWAYDTQPSQIGGPGWLNEDDIRFDVIARAASPADDTQLRLMLRALLADRFGLKAHTEQKEMQVYVLTLAKGGPKFHESTDEGPPVFDRAGPTMLTAHRVTMKDLALQISNPLKRPVIDETGLKGRYEIHIDVSGYMLAAPRGGPDEGSGMPDVMSILFTGLQEQLGVKLDARKEKIDILVIHHAEKSPTAN